MESQACENIWRGYAVMCFGFSLGSVLYSGWDYIMKDIVVHLDHYKLQNNEKKHYKIVYHCNAGLMDFSMLVIQLCGGFYFANKYERGEDSLIRDVLGMYEDGFVIDMVIFGSSIYSSLYLFYDTYFGPLLLNFRYKRPFLRA